MMESLQDRLGKLIEMYNNILIQCLKIGDIDRDEVSLLLQNIKRDLLNGGNN
jgi:hypothetical protein